ncbi:thyrotropin-releasing hormone receptor-like [Patiria miniata]|uniref:G-protein coupled receptors family 1 profile domain-containing protein n=1 Tax=Patiria miniata TaxID=46514 RepID=A0A914AEY8_PATMI|nr:thyrotropin-releasing hormone receptor-like [Patiria miniata]
MGATIQTTTPCDARVNLSDADDQTISQWMYSDIRIQISIISRSIILMVGVVGNGAFFIVSARTRSMHTLVNLYLVHLAVADMLVLLQHAAVPIVEYSVLQIQSDGHLFGASGCMASMFFSYLGYFTSITLVCLMSTERYLAVCHPLKHHSINTKGRASKLIACAWALGVLLSACAIPTSAIFTKTCIEWPDEEKFTTYPTYAGRCVPTVGWASYVFDVIQAVPFFSALVCNAVFFTKIIRNLRGRHEIDQGRGSLHGRRVAHITYQVTKMLVVNGVVFFICHAPFQFLSLCTLVSTLTNLPLFTDPVAQTIITTAFRLLVYANSAVNPLVYNATNSRYRRAFVQVFACSSRARRQAAQSTVAGLALATNTANGRSVQHRLDVIGRQTSNGSILNGALASRDSQHSLITKL